jgi:hypothetical protein
MQCLQEIEINFDDNLTSFPGFNFEIECSTTRRRVGCCFGFILDYLRRNDLAGIGLHFNVLDTKTNVDLRLIYIDRSFNPQTEQNLRNTVLLGDFNLDRKKGVHGYQFNNYVNDMVELLAKPLISFPTWSGIVNGVYRESVLIMSTRLV